MVKCYPCSKLDQSWQISLWILQTPQKRLRFMQPLRLAPRVSKPSSTPLQSFSDTHPQASPNFLSGAARPGPCRHLIFDLDGKTRSFSNSSAQNLCPEEAALCPLDDLLINADRWVVHQDSAGFVVDFGIYTRVADEIDDPLFAFVLV
jgi:hypothetical protein